MTINDFVVLFDYGYWANGKLLSVIAHLPTEHFVRTVDTSHGSIRNTLVHMLSAESLWLSRFQGAERAGHFNPADFPTPQSVIEHWNTHETQMRDFLTTLRDEDLRREIHFTIGGTKKLSMPFGQLLQQSATHGVHHRGQLSLLLRLLGHEPENFDILLYYLQRSNQ